MKHTITQKTTTMTLTYIKKDGKFICPECGAQKNNQSTMHYHMKKHEEQLSAVCKICKKGFLQKQTLELHMKSKHPDINDTKKFKCTHNNCEFTALTKGNCIIHYIRVHFQDEIDNIMIKDGKTVHCIECEKDFSSSCAFYYHCKDCIDFVKDEKYENFEKLLKPIK